jgi:hypothetical protein
VGSRRQFYVFAVRLGLLVMLKVYLDLGQKQDMRDGVMCVGAAMFKQAPYKQFLRPWERMLKRWDAKAFHATDFYNGAGEFKRDTPARQRLFTEDSRRIPGMIGPHINRVLLVSFRPEEYLRVASEQWKKKFGTNLHSLAVQMVLLANGRWAERRRPSESFAYFMESGDPDGPEVSAMVERFGQNPDDSRVVRVRSFTIADKGTARGLEASDFAAWHWNKYYMDKIREGKEDEPRKDFAAFVETSQEKVDSIFLSGANLEYFLSLVPKEVLESENAKQR